MSLNHDAFARDLQGAGMLVRTPGKERFVSADKIAKKTYEAHRERVEEYEKGKASISKET